MNLPELADMCGTDKGAHQGFMLWYERYLPGPDHPVNLLELGVYKGESIKMWLKYFRHREAQIFGIDIDFSRMDPTLACDPRFYFSEWDQADPEAVQWYPYMDVIIDDASHISQKTIASFDIWWPLVMPGGLYVVEDTHCSYDVDYYGMASAAEPERDCYLSGLGASRPKTTMAFLKRLADDVNWNIHGYDRFQPLYTDIAFVHFYPGICFIGKKS
ncbi:methyltransferase [Mycobacterium phage Wildcat]|uniref:Methyltransferase n=2 Tax=Mycobacterium virus Wildcat TaxID=1993859 RepID=Q19Y49_9CAUD|nr:methyltransferase [Mycobacterium phage Wildcat]ABE67616.1 methyltransferase [Mycobacterium phage Wildcat]QGJ89901.1 methyltransferase [Mycobacterium phage MaryV]